MFLLIIGLFFIFLAFVESFVDVGLLEDGVVEVYFSLYFRVGFCGVLVGLSWVEFRVELLIV